MKGIGAVSLMAAVVVTGGCSGTLSDTSGTLDQKQAEIAGTSVMLRNASGRCRLETSASSSSLEIPWPCDFHRGPDNTVRTITAGNTVIFLLENSQPHPDLPDDCVTQLQAVKVNDSDMHVSEYTDKVAACPPFQWDKKMFTGLFAD